MIFIFHFAFLLINENIELNLSKTIHKYNYESVIYANKEKLKKKRTGTKTNRLVSIRQFEFYLPITDLIYLLSIKFYCDCNSSCTIYMK